MAGTERFDWGPQDDSVSINTIHCAVELGVNWIDTAPIFGVGHAEKMLEKAIKRLSINLLIGTNAQFMWKPNKTRYWYDLTAKKCTNNAN
jgi:aryl-alcohol dehydrogenase-like predicted oxidoreductase